MAGAPGIECPICGAPLPGLVEGCPKCGAALPERALRAFMEALGIEAGSAEHLLEPANGPVPSGSEPASPGVLYLCPSCGAFVSGVDVACGKCGTRLTDDSADLERLLEGGATKACPACGESIPADARRCPVCQKAFGVEAAGPPARTAAAPGAASTPSQLETSLEEDLSRHMDAIIERYAQSEPTQPRTVPRKRAVRSPAEVRVPRRIPATSARSSQVEKLRELAFLATVGALLPTAYAARTPSEIARWTTVAVMGSLFAWTFALTLFDPSGLRGKLRMIALAVGGGIALLAVPLHRIAGLAVPTELDVGLLVFGLALIVAGTYRARRSPDVYLPWIASLPGWLVLSVGMAVNVSMGTPEVTGALWIALGGAIAVSGFLVFRRRWVASRVDAAVRRAQDMAMDRDYRGSLAELDRAIRLAGDDGSDVAWYTKGATLVLLGRHAEAVDCIDKALRISARNEVAWVNKGNALARMGRAVDALKCYNSAIKVNPAYEVAWNNKGNTLARLARFEDALKCYERALEIDRKYRGAWVNRGYVYAKLGDYENAARCADEVLRLDGRTPAATG